MSWRVDNSLKILVCGAALLLAVLGGGLVARRSGRGLHRFLRPELLLSGVGVWLILGWLAEWLFTPQFFWNGVRLVPSFSLLSGYDLYYAPDSGPVSGHIYGPIGVLAYLPAAITHSPAAAIRIGSLLASVFYFLPIVLALRQCWKSGGVTRLAAVTGMLLFGVLTLESDSLRYVAFNIHVDSVALAFAMCALVLVPNNIRDVRWQSLLPAAFCAALSIWTKQTMVPLLISLPLAVLMGGGVRSAIRMCLALVLSLSVVSLLCVSIFGFENLRFNMWTVPSRHPWFIDYSNPGLGMIQGGEAGPALRALLRALGGFLFEIRWLIALLGALALLDRRGPGIGNGKTGESHLEIACAVTALLMIPTTCLGRIKVGGDVNTFAYSAYFIAILATLMFVRLHPMLMSIMYAPQRRRMVPVVSTALGVLLAVGIWRESVRVVDHALLPVDPQTQACELVRLGGGTIYFPWQPLAHLCGEGKLYHFGYGTYDRALAGFPLRRKHFLEGLPEQTQRVAFHRKDESSMVMEALPGFSKRQVLDDYPGWYFLSKP